MKDKAGAWHRWVLFLWTKKIRKQHWGVASACRQRAENMLLSGFIAEWRNVAASNARDQQIHTLTAAVESYEQALNEVAAERVALEADKSNLEQAVKEGEKARQSLLQEFESKFTMLQAEHYRTAEASVSWKSKLEDEQYHSHQFLAAARGDIEQLQKKFEDAASRNHHLAEEVAAKDAVISTLEQRVTGLLDELCSLESRYKDREEQALTSHHLSQRVMSLEHQKRNYQLTVNELAASTSDLKVKTSKTTQSMTEQCQKLQGAATLLARCTFKFVGGSVGKVAMHTKGCAYYHLRFVSIRT